MSLMHTIQSYDLWTANEIATAVVHAILRAEKGANELQRSLNDIVGEYGSTEKIAKWTLAKLDEELREASMLGPVIKLAYDQVWQVAKGTKGFAQRHPFFCTVITLGILVLVAPWIIEALGFGELGPIEGSFASRWQARYGGLIPKWSLFSFFQRLGMTWH